MSYQRERERYPRLPGKSKVLINRFNDWSTDPIGKGKERRLKKKLVVHKTINLKFYFLKTLLGIIHDPCIIQNMKYWFEL